MKKALLAAAALAATAFTTPAFAQSGFLNRLYIRGDVGATLGGDVEFDSNATSEGIVLPYNSDAELDVGVIAGGAIGISNFPLPNWRVELEGVYSNTETDDDVDNIGDIFDDNDGVLGDDDLSNEDSTSADVDVYGGFVNVVYDFNNTDWRGFKPFIGAGVGWGETQIEFQGVEAEDDVFMWQAKAGVGYDFNPNFGLELGYRYLNAESAEFNDSDLDLNVSGEVDTDIHAVTVGARYKFGQAY